MYGNLKTIIFLCVSDYAVVWLAAAEGREEGWSRVQLEAGWPLPGPRPPSWGRPPDSITTITIIITIIPASILVHHPPRTTRPCLWTCTFLSPFRIIGQYIWHTLTSTLSSNLSLYPTKNVTPRNSIFKPIFDSALLHGYVRGTIRL